MRPVITILAVASFFGAQAAAQDVPLPRARPDIAMTEPATPSPCQLRLALIAEFAPLPPRSGPGGCGASDLVRLGGVRMPDAGRVAIVPPAELRCEMAEQVADWLREEAAPKFAPAHLTAVANFDSYDCRDRNRVAGARISEHAKGNALDIRAFMLEGGHTISPVDAAVAHALREDLKRSACARFTTVLGPGSDGYHEGHIHLDLAERHNGYRICHWVLRDLPMATVPLPPRRPPWLTAGNDDSSL